jgi:hypothetical protein
MPSNSSPVLTVEFDRSREHWLDHDNRTYSELGAKQLKDTVDLLLNLWANGSLPGVNLQVTLSTDPSLVGLKVHDSEYPAQK